jgi:hypothetical protein
MISPNKQIKKVGYENGFILESPPTRIKLIVRATLPISDKGMIAIVFVRILYCMI